MPGLFSSGRRARGPRVSSAITMTLASLLVAGGCGATVPAGEIAVVTETVATVTGWPEQGGVAAPGTVEPRAEPQAEPEPPPGPAGADLDAVVAAAGTPGAGVATTPVGVAGEVRSAGAWKSGVAWSTIKVPMAVAVSRRDPAALEPHASAITVSDNQAAENLWEYLGGGADAAAAVGAVLAEAGDVVSRVPHVHTRVGYSIFGQTEWSLSEQARFAAALPCIAGAGAVVDLMGRVSPEQRWGLGRIPGARFKGGWGPGEVGGYLVRQFGLVPAAGGDVAVALAVDAPTFEQGTRAVSAMADALAARLGTAPGGRC